MSTVATESLKIGDYVEGDWGGSPSKNGEFEERKCLRCGKNSKQESG